MVLLSNLSAHLFSYSIAVMFGPQMQTLAEGISRIFIIIWLISQCVSVCETWHVDDTYHRTCA